MHDLFSQELDHEVDPMNGNDIPSSGRPPLASQNGNSTLRSATNPESLIQRYSDDEQGTGLNAKGLDAIQPSPTDPKDRKPRSVKEYTTLEHSVEQPRNSATNGERHDD